MPQGHDVLPELPPADFCDLVVEAYKKDIDRTLLRENLKLPVGERVRKAESLHQSIALARGSARRAPLSNKETD